MSPSSASGSGAPPPPPPPGRDPQQLKEDLARMKILAAEARDNRLRQQQESQARMAKVRQMYPVSFIYLFKKCFNFKPFANDCESVPTSRIPDFMLLEK